MSQVEKLKSEFGSKEDRTRPDARWTVFDRLRCWTPYLFFPLKIGNNCHLTLELAEKL